MNDGPKLTLEQFGCYVELRDSTLFCVAMSKGGLWDLDGDDPNWYEVTDPQSQEFLDAVNNHYKTTFKLSDF